MSDDLPILLKPVPDLPQLLKRAAGKEARIPSGIYLVSHPLAFTSSTTLVAQGPVTIKMAPDFPVNTPLFETPDPVGGLRVVGVNFEGNGNPAPTRGLVEFGRLDDSTFQRCGFRHHPRHLFVVAASSRLEWNGCTFENWGALDPIEDNPDEPDGGNAILIYATDNLYNRVTDCVFRDGKWSAMQLEGQAFTQRLQEMQTSASKSSAPRNFSNGTSFSSG